MFAYALRILGRALLLLAALLLSIPVPALEADVRMPLWEIRSDSTTVYLFGTIHVGKREFYPLPAAVENAYRRASVLALEVDSTDVQALTDAVSTAFYTPPDKLESHLPEELRARLKKVLNRLGLPFDQVQPMKPFMVMLTLTSLEYARLGYDSAMGLDIHFADRAVKDGKKIVQLESAASQFAMMNSLSPGLQQELLELTLKEIEDNELPSLVEAMVKAWTTSDLDKLSAVLTAEERRLSHARAAEFHDKFLAARNAAMTEKIEALLRERTVAFVAVGAAHVLGDDGIMALLKKKGYRIKQL
ncbi:MAG TPA: TraB/GumN family protein [Burkholderiales bacterium]|jgi:uncharacterized protein YbaP (TraB family)|nr:TraB/GumN family protein [Burkholderiales bacterium]